MRKLLPKGPCQPPCSKQKLRPVFTNSQEWRDKERSISFASMRTSLPSKTNACKLILHSPSLGSSLIQLLHVLLLAVLNATKAAGWPRPVEPRWHPPRRFSCLLASRSLRSSDVLLDARDPAFAVDDLIVHILHLQSFAASNMLVQKKMQSSWLSRFPSNRPEKAEPQQKQEQHFPAFSSQGRRRINWRTNWGWAFCPMALSPSSSREAMAPVCSGNGVGHARMWTCDPFPWDSWGSQ